MLYRVLKEDYKFEFMHYGILEVPKGTAVDYKAAGDHEFAHLPLLEYDWIDEKYPDQSKELKADAIRNKIMIPKEQLTLALRIRFIYDNSGYCRDIYKAINGEYKYCRMESRSDDRVEWLTVTPDWEEPNCPLRTDMLIQVVDENGKVIITEQQEKIDGEYRSEKRYPFSWEKTVDLEIHELISKIYGL